VAKVLDYRGKWEELERNPNIFAIVVTAVLRTIETKRNARRRLDWKLTLMKLNSVEELHAWLTQATELSLKV
jgi:hypothetical protein